MRVEASQKWFQANGDMVNEVADRIVQRIEGEISQFWLAQQQNYQASELPVMTTHLRLNGQVFLEYQAVHSAQQLTITVYPENESNPQSQSSVDLNLDGYFAWMMNYPAGFEQYQPSSIIYNFQLNGQTFYTYSGPFLNFHAIIFTFGKTALKCQSLVDKTKADQNAPGNPNQPLVSSVLPPRPTVQSFVNNTGTTITEHPDLPGYFVYYYDQTLNIEGSNFTEPNPTLISTIACDPKLLNNKGLNQFRVLVTPNQPFTGSSINNLYWAYGYVMYAEFYSRSDLRTAEKSWRMSSGAQDITVNDKPLYWQMYSGAYPVQALDVDFSVKVDYSKPTPSNNQHAFTPTIYADAFDPAGLTLWANTPCTGLWRPGDAPATQPMPPNGLWAVAYSAASETLAIWNNVLYALWLLNAITLPSDPRAPTFDKWATWQNQYAYTGTPWFNIQVSTQSASTPFEKSIGATHISFIGLALNAGAVFPMGSATNVNKNGMVYLPQDFTPGTTTTVTGTVTMIVEVDGPIYPYTQLCGYVANAYAQAAAAAAAYSTAKANLTTQNTFADQPAAMSMIETLNQSAQQATAIIAVLRTGGTWTNGYTTTLIDSSIPSTTFLDSRSTSKWGLDPLYTSITDLSTLPVSPVPGYYVRGNLLPVYSAAPPTLGVQTQYAAMTGSVTMEQTTALITAVGELQGAAQETQVAINQYDLKPGA